jgi:hypothetical protein
MNVTVVSHRINGIQAEDPFSNPLNDLSPR